MMGESIEKKVIKKYKNVIDNVISTLYDGNSAANVSSQLLQDLNK